MMTCRRRARGFTMVELITVIVVMGVLGAIGASRFFDSTTYSVREYGDQAKNLMRYAQKLAIARNREVYVRSEPTGFAVCYSFDCAAGQLAEAPGGSNSGATATRSYCAQGASYVANWACEGRPAGIVASAGTRPELAAGGYFFFDAMGRPFNKADQGKTTSSFAQMTMTFSGNGSVFPITIEAETGYVH